MVDWIKEYTHSTAANQQLRFSPGRRPEHPCLEEGMENRHRRAGIPQPDCACSIAAAEGCQSLSGKSGTV